MHTNAVGGSIRAAGADDKRRPGRSRHAAALCGALGILAIAGCTDQVVGPSPQPQPATASRGHPQARAIPTSIDWQGTWRGLVTKYATSPVATTRGMALLGLAQYAAVSGLGEDEGDKASNGWRAQRGAVAGASAEMLAYLYPNEKSMLDAKVREQEAAEGPPRNPQFARAEIRGRAAAAELIARARLDGFGKPWTGTVPVGDPSTRPWRSSSLPPVFPTLGEMTPFLLTRGDQFRPGPPPALGSETYARDLAEVVAFSRLPSTDPIRVEQIAIARRWATISTSGYWSARAAGLIETTGMGEREATHVFALVGAASMDAIIGCWDAKYTYWLWRPVHADPTIALAIGMPNHPSYPSGHSCNSSAAAEVLAAKFPFEAGPLNDEVVEAGMSRVYGGIHFQFDCLTGQDLGRAVARYTLEVDRQRGILQALR